MDINSLPPETAKLWSSLEAEPLLAGSFLVGGTALALQISHRLSEDLDFIYPTDRLPRKKIDLLISRISENNHQVERNDNPAVYDEFLVGGESLHDFQQNFLIDGATKISFFTADPETKKVLTTPANSDRPVVPSVQELFAMKALLVNKRNKTRDWLDLYILLKNHNFTLSDFRHAYDKASNLQSLDHALNKLCAIPDDFKDEGFATLLDKAPSLSEMRSFFIQTRDKYESDVARQKFSSNK